MIAILRYRPTSRLTRSEDQRSAKRTGANEHDERNARIRENVGLKEGRDHVTQVFSSYGNGPFLMPSLQFPC